MNKPAALYARVSSDRQKENHTMGSQVAALRQFADTNGYLVPLEWQFQDDGYSGATLVRPGLEALRDLAATGEIQAVLVYSPDRLSRKYAYQVLLAEELARCGVELIFLRAPSGATAEDQLLVQFQGMIAEYERAQIAERSRRGKRHRAQQGSINVLSGAPYGYRYVKKTDTSAAYYEVVETEAEVVRLIFDAYTRQGLSLGAIAGYSTNARCRRGRDIADGNVPPFGRCCITQRTRGAPSMAKPSFVRGSESHAACASVAGAAVTVRFGNGLVRTGSKSPCPPWSAKQRSLWRKSNSRKIRGFLPDVRSNHPCCRGCWSVSIVVMDSTELRREPASARSTTIAAWDGMATGI
jgi:DNA invertase Pin-like site-specific DNA recombinase